MTLSEFRDSVRAGVPPDGLSDPLRALWSEAQGDWEDAHELVQTIHHGRHALVHAYLHRREGDYGNAAYWYSRAGRRMPGVSLEEEWNALVTEFLESEER